MTITLEWWQWLLPVVVACAAIGLMMGYKIMGLWTVGVFFSGLVAASGGPKLGLFLTKIVSVAGQFFAIAASKDETSIITPKVTIASPWEPVATGVFYLMLIVLSWWVARKLGTTDEVAIVGRLVGAVFGGIAAVLALSQAFGYWTDFVSRNGSNPSEGASVVVPQIAIGVAGLPSSNPFVGMATMAIGLFLLLIIVYTIWRALRSES